MFRKTYLNRVISFLSVVFVIGISAACGRGEERENRGQEIFGNNSQDDETTETGEEKMPLKNDRTEDVKEDEMIQKFGEDCIAEQTFEVELSEYSGKVFFVPLAPSKENQKFRIQIVQNNEVLSEIPEYIPDKLEGKEFDRLDAVSFYDVNYDDNTDIVLVLTYGDTSFAAVYYGYADGTEDYGRYFMIQEQLSQNISEQVENLTIPEIRNFLSYGKKNGEFADYQEAYKAAGRLCGLEGTEEIKYNLIYFDEDDTPELAAGVEGYYTSLYAYHEGKIYTLMDRWPYGAMGNSGYEYSPRKNSLRNYNSDYAGAILYTTYMEIGSQYSMDTVTEIKTYNFDDVNGNEIPDEDEMGSMGLYGIHYIDGKEVSAEECASYDVGGYESIGVTMDFGKLQSELGE